MENLQVNLITFSLETFSMCDEISLETFSMCDEISLETFSMCDEILLETFSMCDQISLETFSMRDEMNKFFRTILRHSASSSESSPPPLLLPEQHSWEALDQLPGAVFPLFDRVQVLYLENMSSC